MSNQKRYRKKPVVIEAMHFVGETSGELHDTYLWVESHVGSIEPYDQEATDGVSINPETGQMFIRTLEGDMTVSIGDYVIRGVNGEFYPCKPDIFAKTYEEATK